MGREEGRVVHRTWRRRSEKGGGTVGNSGRRKKGRKARRKGNLLGNYKVTSSGDAHSCEYSNAITSMIA